MFFCNSVLFNNFIMMNTPSSNKFFAKTNSANMRPRRGDDIIKSFVLAFPVNSTSFLLSVCTSYQVYYLPRNKIFHAKRPACQKLDKIFLRCPVQLDLYSNYLGCPLCCWLINRWRFLFWKNRMRVEYDST